MTAKPEREPTPREKFKRMIALTRRLVAVPKSELSKAKAHKRRKRATR